jgi:hypothetical protein
VAGARARLTRVSFPREARGTQSADERQRIARRRPDAVLSKMHQLSTPRSRSASMAEATASSVAGSYGDR